MLILSRQGLQALESQAFGILYAGQIKPADEGRDHIAITVGQSHQGIDGNSLGVHGLLVLTAASSRIAYTASVNPVLTVFKITDSRPNAYTQNDAARM
ncbi:hypothetical protein [Bradyrhizobium sp. dw_78]|uniref:hypothetical protein n=1 Tax=Bradyrhizobium sp. dw_78 TaxID=2719793 RepID=UPI001BD47DB6|nr:hypothetical protein [Bradyrhizobium sp. dw_78]